jgi:hypothetical protein
MFGNQYVVLKYLQLLPTYTAQHHRRVNNPAILQQKPEILQITTNYLFKLCIENPNIHSKQHGQCAYKVTLQHVSVMFISLWLFHLNIALL